MIKESCMKKLFITLFLLVFCVSISGAGIVDSLKSVIARKNSVCVKDTVTLVMDQTDEDVGIGLDSFNAIGQSISLGSGWTLHSMKIMMGEGACGNYRPAAAVCILVYLDL